MVALQRSAATAQNIFLRFWKRVSIRCSTN